MSSASIRFGLALGLAIAISALILAAISPSVLSRSIEAAAPVERAATDGSNLLINPDFESGYTRPLSCCNNIAVPVGWNIRWYTDTATVIEGTSYAFKQPEVKMIDNTQWPFCAGCTPNIPPRIHNGRYAVDAFVLFAQQDTALYQQVGHIPIGAVVTGTAWLQAWASSCNPFPQNATLQVPAISLQAKNDPANGYACANGYWPIDTTHMMVGIDPDGGTDPRAASVIWNWNEAHPTWWGPYDNYSPTLPVVVTARAYTVTLYLRGVTRQPTRYDDLYFDSASLTTSFPVEWQIDQAQEWPLSTAITIGLQAPLSLTQVSAALQEVDGTFNQLKSLGSTAAAPYTLAWRFTPHSAGPYRFTLAAHELPDPLVKTIEVTALPFSYEQDQLFSGSSGTTSVAYTLTAPITLTNLTALIGDAQDQTLSATWVLSDFAAGRYRAVGSFTPLTSGWHTVTLSAAEFMQPFMQPIPVFASRLFLPIVLRGF